MDVGAKQIQDVCLRLSSLEALARKMNEELLSVQKENVFLQREVLHVQRENKELKEKIDAIQGNVTTLNQASNDQKQGIEKLKKLEGDVTVLKQIPNQVKQQKQKLQSLHTDVAGLKQLPNQIKQLNGKLKTNDQKTDARMNQLGELRRVLSRALVGGHGGRVDVKKEVDKLSKRLMKKIAPLEKKKNQIDQSRIDLDFNTASLQLVHNKEVILDKCLNVITNGGCWNAASSKIRVNVTGHYLVSVLCSQEGNGKIFVTLKSDDGIVIRMTDTDHNNHLVVSTQVIRANEQSNMWLVANLVRGTATLDQCWLYCQLM